MEAVVSFSGGMDSATLLAEAVAQRNGVLAVGFTYGSKHNPHENAAAKKICDHYGVPFRLVDLSGVMAGFKSDLMKTGGDIPEGYYEAESMRRTVVPGRNLIFASVLTGIAWSESAGEVWMGVHAGDHFIYPDCRPEWFAAMREAIERGSDNKVTLVAPYLHTDKVGILKRGFKLKVPYHLTRTCYKDQSVACGKCGSCQERLTAFATHGVSDPAEYETRVLIPK